MDSPTTRPSKKPPVIDLFAGVGGLSLGACRAGFHLQLAVEKDRHAFAAHAANFHGSLHSNSDIANLTGASLLSEAQLKPGELWGLIGGPPCQGFSSIGHRDVKDTRNLLFTKFFRLVQEVRPKFFLAENVPGLMDPCYKAIRKEALDLLDDYSILEPFKVRASDFGAPTVRTRVLFIGCLKEIAPFEPGKFLPPEKTMQSNVRIALAGLPKTIKEDWDTDETAWRKIRDQSENGYLTSLNRHIPHGVGEEDAVTLWRTQRITSGCIATHHEAATIRRFKKLGHGEIDAVSRAMRLDPDGFCPTLRAGTDNQRGSYQAVRPIHPSEPRVITPREAARLQGFPDWFRFAPTKWHSFRQIGNSVSPIVAEYILTEILKHLTNATNEKQFTKRSAA